jgi:putative transposase
MLNITEWENWCALTGMSNESISMVNQIRSSQPARLVRSAKGNVSGRYPSRKMSVTIQFESHRNELAFINVYEDDDDVLEYYDQPSTIKLTYETANGRRLGVLHTPDFFIIRAESAGWEECKSEEELTRLASKSPGRYVRDADGEWRCPPGEEYAQKLGFYYRLRSSKEIDWTYQRNLEFLEDYYRGVPSPTVPKARTLILTKVAETPGITLQGLLEYCRQSVKTDDVFNLLVTGDLYINLQVAPLVEQNKVHVYLNRETAIAYEHLSQIQAPTWLDVSQFIDMKVGTAIQWDGKGWMIVNVGETMISLVGEGKAVTELPIITFEKLVQDHRITSLISTTASTTHPEVEKCLAQADTHAFATANRRYEIVRAYLSSKSLPPGANVPERTLRRWLAAYRISKETYGNGYIALLPKKRSGNTKDKLPQSTGLLLSEFIEKDYETEKQKGKVAVYAAYQLSCERHGVLPASYKSFTEAVKRRPRYKQALKRQGDKAAYKQKEFYWQLTSTIPRHGDWPLHIAHIDHTELDVELVCSLTGKNLGRPWATFLTDAYSRRLAVHITYDPPSYRSNMMIMRECVRRFGRLPQIVVVDGGKDFSSTYFETLLAWFECTKKSRPASESRFGSVCERLFNTSNSQFVHTLRGNTQVTRNVRQITRHNNPKGNAIWTLETAFLYMRAWAYEVYDTIEHPSLGQSPRDAFASGMIRAGERAHRLIPYNEQFRLLTLPSTAKGTAKVYVGRGVKINRIYYWSDTFRHPEVEGSRVRVRFDPLDAGSSFAYVRGEWTECLSEHWSAFRGRSERELMLATEEMRRRHTLHSRRFNVTAMKLAHFLESVEAEEVLLQQRLADRATRNVLALVDGRPQHLSELETIKRVAPMAGKADNKTSSHSPSLNDSSSDTKLEVYGEF